MAPFVLRACFMSLSLVAGALSFLGPTAPHWAATYDMGMSTITMACNGSGLSSPQRGAEFGIVSYDWSNMKAQWAATKPMDSEMLLYEQAKKTKAVNPKSHVFVYRNVVKALPWMKTVREKLDDPAYSGWFLKFNGNGNYSVPACAAENKSHCSVFYHDQEQTPELPTSADPHPDGNCVGYCDCGVEPCGEYLFDHRNGSMLRNWIVDELIAGPTGTGAPEIDGLFIDDFWCSDLLCKTPGTSGCPCSDPVQGPTEIDRHSQADMGLSDESIRDITIEWNKTMAAAQQKMLDTNAYTWSLIKGQENANASPDKLEESVCATLLTKACTATSDWQVYPKLFGFTINSTHQLPQLKQDLAYFLLVRGPYAWAGWGVWGMTWPFNPEPAHGELPPNPHGVPRPNEFDVDYGVPKGLCHETTKNVFTRDWTKSTITLNCNTFEATIQMIN